MTEGVAVERYAFRFADWIEGNRDLYVWVPPGASPETLKRRAGYGGRKGRRAAKRLAALPRWGVRFAVKAEYALAMPEGESP